MGFAVEFCKRRRPGGLDGGAGRGVGRTQSHPDQVEPGRSTPAASMSEGEADRGACTPQRGVGVVCRHRTKVAVLCVALTICAYLGWESATTPAFTAGEISRSFSRGCLPA